MMIRQLVGEIGGLVGRGGNPIRDRFIGFAA